MSFAFAVYGVKPFSHQTYDFSLVVRFPDGGQSQSDRRHHKRRKTVVEL